MKNSRRKFIVDSAKAVSGAGGSALGDREEIRKEIDAANSPDQLAGVMGHEMGHADLRHSTRQLTKMYGVQTLIGIIAGDREGIKQISSALIGLSFSRSHETNRGMDRTADS